MNQTIIFGNIITMDDKRPFAKAALVKDGVFAYIGVIVSWNTVSPLVQPIGSDSSYVNQCHL